MAWGWGGPRWSDRIRRPKCILEKIEGNLAYFHLNK